MKNIDVNFIIAESIGQAWLRYCLLALEKGKLISSGSEAIYEISETVITIDYSEKRDNILEAYCDKDLIELYKKKMFSFDLIPELNSTYGDMLFNNQGINQVNWLIENLRENPLSKSASIGLLSPIIFNQKRRIPCLTTITLKIRENRLELYATFRSQNIYRSYANFEALFEFGRYLSRELNFPVGFLSLFIISPHIYDEDLEKIKRTIQEYGPENIK